jgi:hypothetical protein
VGNEPGYRRLRGRRCGGIGRRHDAYDRAGTRVSPVAQDSDLRPQAQLSSLSFASFHLVNVVFSLSTTPRAVESTGRECQTDLRSPLSRARVVRRTSVGSPGRLRPRVRRRFLSGTVLLKVLPVSAGLCRMPLVIWKGQENRRMRGGDELGLPVATGCAGDGAAEMVAVGIVSRPSSLLRSRSPRTTNPH